MFEPRSFAVIGASRNPNKLGHTIVRNIVSGGYRGKLHLVSPSGGEIFGLRISRSIEEIEEEIDQATIVIPAKFVVEAVRGCAQKGVKYVQIISSGFSEAGNTRDEEEVMAIAREHGMRVLGPNMFGLYSAASSLNSTFSATGILPGHVAILTQSGALGVSLIGKTLVENIGLSAVVSLGNKADVDEADLLGYLVDQDRTRVVLMYIEGIRNGQRFSKALMRATEKKPVVVIRSGSSKRGAQAAASHTGALAGSDEVFGAIMRQCGVLRAESIEEAFNWCKFLAFSPRPKENRAVIVTNGGGVGVLAADACEKYGVELLDDQEVLKQVFEPSTPSFGSTKNPVDITGSADSVAYEKALSAPVGSDVMDATIALYCETATFDAENLAPMIRETHRMHMQAEKPVTYALIGGEAVQDAIWALRKESVPVFNDVHPAVSCLGAANWYHDYTREKKSPIEEAEIDVEAIDGVVKKALAEGREFLLAHEATAVMNSAGVRMPRSKIVRTIPEAVEVAQEIGCPVVMKIASRDILHKSDAGGVALGLEDEKQVVDAYEAIIQNCKEYKPDASIEGVEVCEMVRPGTEFIIGARNDASFGPIVMCGLGGVYVEVMKDVVFRGLPVSSREVMKMLEEIRSFPLLLGVRGEPRRDIRGVVDTVIRVGTIIAKCRSISDIELNPIVVYEEEKGLMAVDARVLVGRPRKGS